MGYGLQPIPFWTDDIEVAEVIEATLLSDFNIHRLRDLGTSRLNHASLHARDDCDWLVLDMAGGEFIVFRQATKDTRHEDQHRHPDVRT